ncbi:MAG: cytochrome c3 family protein [Deltaproteobacteria bacterium]|nr:cytochrome c3 family protein [Deltaproteobacteria bacterium]
MKTHPRDERSIDDRSIPRPLRVLTATTLLAVVAGAGVACSGGRTSVETDDEALGSQASAMSSDDDREDCAGIGEGPAVGLALEVSDGAGVPLSVKRGQRFYLNQLDVRTAIQASVDEGVAGLDRTGDFARLPWQGVRKVDEAFVGLPGPDGFERRRFYRGAAWMEAPSSFVITQLDARGRPTAPPLVVSAGTDNRRRESDAFFTRRFRAIQYTRDCVSKESCAGATKFEEEALIELRYAMSEDRSFRIRGKTTQIAVRWSLRPGAPWTIPVTQVDNPPYAYGFRVDVEPVTPARADGTYAPGTAITFRLTLRDGEGQRLHPPGAMPSYNEVVFGPNPAGIQYYRAFFDPTTTYYRRKHQERNFISQIIGPMQNVQPIRSIAELGTFLDPAIDVQDIATQSRDGVFAQFRLFPTAVDLFGGAFDPLRAGWAKPVPDTWVYTLPPDAVPGTYTVTTKARRTYLGEDIPYTSNVTIQVGTNTPTTATLTTGPCNTCHSGGGSLKKVLHANDNRAACAACHTPLAFELEGPVYVRTHFIHSRSDRFDAPLSQCKTCHLGNSGIQRTSKSACLSCHKSYPSDHVERFGPIKDMYVGGDRESFEQCSTSCHTTHPGSGLTP